jgi:hypothetical protein
MVSITVLLEGSITETKSEPELATYMRPFFGLNAMPRGLEPTPMVAKCVSLVVLNTETVPEPVLVTYKSSLAGFRAKPSGFSPTPA